jgi:glycosyltransferase involved in cell wall biosynthesis
VLSLSVVVPVYQGEAYLEALCSALAGVREKWSSAKLPIELAEAIFVDDGAIDGSPEILGGLRQRHAWVRVVTLSRNFGQHAATVAGLLHSSGDWVASLDEDLQHHPTHLLEMLESAVRQSLDVVYAKPRRGPHGSFVRDVGSRAVKRFAGWVLRNPAVRDFNSFRLIRGSIGRAAAAMSGHDTYFDAALCWFTRRIGSLELDLRDPRREAGAPSGYRFGELLRHARRLLFSSELHLLRTGVALGGTSILLSLGAGIFTIGLGLARPELVKAREWTSLLLIVLFFGGLISLLLTVLMELMTTVVLQAKGKPRFFVVDRSGDQELLDAFERLRSHADSRG